MTEHPIVLTDTQLLDHTMTMLQTHIPLNAHGYVCQTADLWQVLLAAASGGGSIAAACADLETAPDANTIRGYLTAQWQPHQIRSLEDHWTQALHATLPFWLRTRPVALAIDTHLEPFHGHHDPTHPASWVVRAEARAGTTRFYGCATADVLERNAQVAVAVTFLHPTDSMVAVVTLLLDRVAAAGVTISCRHADKGFCSVAVIRLLQARRIPAILALPVRGKAGGTRALCRGAESYRTGYTIRSQRDGAVSVRAAVVRTYARRRPGPRKRQWCLFVCLGVLDPPHMICERYRKRFGIESGYRLAEAVRVRTSSPNPALRFALLGLALVVLNVWVRGYWQHLRVPGRGPRRVRRDLLRLPHFRRWLLRAIEQIYAVVRSIEISPFQRHPLHLNPESSKY